MFFASLAPTMNTVTSGLYVTMSSPPRSGQFTKSRDSSPLETRESTTGCTTPVLPASSPSDGPSDPASESPPIQSRSGSPEFSGARHK
jgi:hypothetical protein